MVNIESYLSLFCLDHPDTNIIQVSDFIEWIFVTGNYIFQKFFQIYTTRRSLNAVIW